MKKILFYDFSIQSILDHTNSAVGGSSIQSYSWVKGLLKNNMSVGIFFYKGGSPSELSVDVIPTYNPEYGVRKFRLIYYRLPLIIASVIKYKPDIIYQSCAGIETLVAALLSKALNIPFVYRCANDIETDKRIKGKGIASRICFNIGARLAQLIVCQNNYQYNNLIMKFPRKKVEILYNPFSPTNHIPNMNILTNKRNYIAWLGLFQYQKNLSGLLKIAKDMPNIEIRIAGKFIESFVDLETRNAIQKLKSLNNVTFMGLIPRDEVSAFLMNSIALINTSHYEGFSNTFLEAFYVGTPVITMERVDPDGIISKNNLGLISKDIEGMVKNIHKIVSCSNIADFSRNCREYVIKNHNSVDLSRALLKLINKND